MPPHTFRLELRAAGLTQRRLAALLGVSRSTVNRWCDDERTDRLNPPIYAVRFVRAWAELADDARERVSA
jgi:transcriptional regulator with XRE-family HTH domain